MKKLGIFLTTLILLGGCSSGNIKIPEEHMAPKEAKKGDSYIFLENLKHGAISKIGETKDGLVRLRLLVTTKGNDVDELNLYYTDDNLKKVSMDSIGVYKGIEFYQGEIEVATDNLEYFFEAKDGRVRYFFGETGDYTPKKIEKYTYEATKNKILKIPRWSENALWYGINVDTFKNEEKDNDPIFNEMGPEYFFQPRSKTSDGKYKSDLIDKGLWRSVDALGEFTVSDWTGNFNNMEAYEKNMVSKYKNDAGRNTRRYGGDLQGVEKKIAYLKDMGIEVINLSPVFYSYSSHKNDVIDYRHVSPDFASIKTKGKSEYQLLDIEVGTDKNKLGEGLDSSTWKMTESDKVLESLIKKSHYQDMKVVLDVNLSYVSKRFWALKQVMLQGKESPYVDWFYLEDNWENEIEYKGTSSVGVIEGEDGKKYRKAWVEIPKGSSAEVREEIYRWNFKNMGIKSVDEDKNMIKVNYSSETYRKYIIESLKKWIELGVDGYKLDVANVPKEFIRELEGVLSEENEELLLVSVWGSSPDLENKNLHSKENYVLGSIILDYLDKSKNLNKEDFENAFYIYSKINTLESVYASPLYLDSKETDRLFSMMINPGRKYDSLNNPKNNYMNIRPDIADGSAVARVKNASLIQLTMHGSPYIYYGSEVGMWGSDAPYNRKPMLWENQNNKAERDRYETYENLGKLNLGNVDYNKVRKYVEYDVKTNSNISTHYDKILRFRMKNLDIFRGGKVRFLEVRDEETGEVLKDILAYERILEEKRIIVVINRSGKSEKIGVYTDGRGEFESLFKEDRKKVVGKRLKVDIGPLEGEIYFNSIQ